MSLEAEKVSFSYGKKEKNVLNDFSLRLKEKTLSMLLGRNGCGKSTALKVLSGMLVPQSGRVLLDGKCVRDYSGRERAKRLAYSPQTPAFEPELSVRALVTSSRCASFPHFSGETRADKDAVSCALAFMRIEHLSDRLFPTLSGGEKQKVLLASALAQEPKTLLLDEPVSASDPANTLETFSLLLALKERMTILVVTHDLTLAPRYADNVFMMKEGSICAEGTPDKVLTDENVSEVYSCNMEKLFSSDGFMVPHLTRLN